MCCGAKRRVTSQPVGNQGNKAIIGIQQSTVQNTSPTPINMTNRGFSGVRSQVQKRCPKCSWPMNSMRRYDTQSGGQVQVYACMNRKCLYREQS